MNTNNYRTQNCCKNCKHSFHREEYDEQDQYYCTLNAPERPLCGSFFMRESFYTRPIDKEVFEPKREAWRIWKEGKEVDSSAICDKYENSNKV